MTLWGGGGAGGWSTNIGGGGGGMPQQRNADGWDEDYLGKVYDAEVVRRLTSASTRGRPSWRCSAWS